jgi:rod shape determining protein RodA
MVDLRNKTIRDIDWVLVLAPLALTVFGCIGIHSTAPNPGTLKRQLIAMVIGIVLAAGLMLADYRKIIINAAPFIYGAALVLLVLVFFVGVEVNGNKAWLEIPKIGSFQPSEFAKVATILMLARYMAQPRQSGLSLKDIVVMGAITAPPVVLIALEKDTGTMLTFGAILGSFYFMGGIRKAVLAGGLVVVAIGLVVVFPHLKEYQKERVKVIIDPSNANPKGYGYQTIQSVIAVGSGGVLGKGIGNSTQGKLGFLPYAWTDFIGAVIAEEMGLIGVLFMIVLYLLLMWRLISIAHGARDRAGALMIMGVVCLLAFHIMCNLGMVVGLMPIMGIRLPLMSAGGSAVISAFACVGLAMSVRLRRFVN